MRGIHEVNLTILNGEKIRHCVDVHSQNGRVINNEVTEVLYVAQAFRLVFSMKMIKEQSL